MDHDQKVCPRCGEPAGDYRSCESCRSHPDLSTEIPTHAPAHGTGPIYPAAQPPREVRRFEQALGAASNGESDRITTEVSAAAVQVDPDPRPVENLTGALEIGKFSTSVDERVSDRAQAPREVARFEDVLTVAATDGTDRSVAKTAADVMPEVQPARTDADDTPDDVNAAPATEVEVPTSNDGSDGDWGRLRREVARLEQVLIVAATDGTDRGVAKAAADQAQASEPIYVAGHALREAFWYEQVSAFKSNGDREVTTRQSPQAAVPEVDPDSSPADSTTRNVEPDPCEADTQPCAEPNGSRSVVRLWLGQTSRRHWVAAICLLALVAVLTGRDIRRVVGEQPN